jgi:hypothetical protein
MGKGAAARRGTSTARHRGGASASAPAEAPAKQQQQQQPPQQQQAAAARDCLAWLGRRVTLNSSSEVDEAAAEELVLWRERLCWQRRVAPRPAGVSEAAVEALADLLAHGVDSVEKAWPLADSHGKWVRQAPLEVHASRFLGPTAAEASAPEAGSPAPSQGRGRARTCVLLVVLLAVVLLLLAASWLPAIRELFGGARRAARAPCAAEAATRLGAAHQAVQRKAAELGLTLGRADARSSAAATLRDLAEQLTTDWADAATLELGDSPPHAVSLRLQGSDAGAVAAVAAELLDALLGPACRRTQVLDLDLAATSGKEAVARVGAFLTAAKRNNEDELAVVLLRGCHQRAANRAAMAFKDHIYMGTIPTNKGEGAFSGAKAVPSRGVAFFFLGGDLPDDQECHTRDLQEHDSAHGWDDNVIGRIRLRTRLCPHKLERS